MNKKYCQIVLVGHSPDKLILSIDKEITQKIIFITEVERLPGTPEAKKTLSKLTKYYKERKLEVENVKFSFNIQTKPIAELVHLIYQQKLKGFDEIIINVSGGLRYVDIWFYIACSITNSKIIHGDFIYEGNREAGIISNMELITIPFESITDKQFEFLSYFFREFEDFRLFFSEDYTFDKNPLISQREKFKSLKELRETLEKEKNKKNYSRGAINGYVKKLNRISALKIYPNPEDKKEKTIEISYLGIAFFLHRLYEKNYRREKNSEILP